MAITFYKTKNGEMRYRASIWKGNRPIKSKSFRRKLDAQGWEERSRIQMEDHGTGRLKGEKMSLKEFSEQVYWPNKLIRDGTARDYRYLFMTHAQGQFGERKLVSISSDEWATHFSKLVAKGMSKARTNRLHAVMSAIYRMAFKFNYVASNPLHRVDWFEDNLHDFDYWSFDEVQKFLSTVMTSKNPRFPLYQTTYETGMRLSELVALQRDCVDLENGIIRIRRSFCKVTKLMLPTTKSGRNRILGINPGLKATLQKELQRHDSQFIFCDPKGTPLSHNEIRHYFDRDQKLCEMRRISFHDLRHTFASHFVMKGGSIYDLKELLGHSDVVTSMRYAHLAPSHLKAQASLVQFCPNVSGKVVELPFAKHFPNIGGENGGKTELLTTAKNQNKVATSAT